MEENRRAKLHRFCCNKYFWKQYACPSVLCNYFEAKAIYFLSTHFNNAIQGFLYGYLIVNHREAITILYYRVAPQVTKTPK